MFYKKFLRLFISIAMFFLLSMVIVNYFFDGGYLFYRAEPFEEQLTRAFLTQKSALICTNFNDRHVKKALIENMQQPVQVLIFGSSRSMPIRQDLFRGLSFFNASVTGGTLDDDLALYYLYQKKGWHPKIVMISLDQWLINKNTLLFPWKMALALESNALKIILKKPQPRWLSAYYHWFANIDRYSQLFSIYYFKASIINYASALITNPTQQQLAQFPHCSLQFPNGTRLTSNREEATAAAQAIFSGTQDIQRSSMPLVLDQEKMQLLDNFVNYLQHSGVTVVFYLPPYEPASYRALQKDPNYHVVSISEHYFLDLAHKYHLSVIGSYDPTQLNLNSDYFIDDVHLKKAGIDQIFQSQIFS
jgi:hypothetical protein